MTELPLGREVAEVKARDGSGCEPNTLIWFTDITIWRRVS